jgi:5-methylcytosine-specific restriction endonuclease McrA
MPKKLIDRTGTTYGRLTYTRYVGRNRFKQSLWEARCSCGASVPAVQHGSAESCGCLLIERNHGPKPHSEEHRKHISEAKSRKDTARNCRRCAAPFVGTKQQLFCTVKCSRAFRGQFDGRRERHWTRKTGAKYEAVSFQKVYERDGGACQICWKPVDRSLRGDVRNPLAPTLDHIIPLSKGGAHTYANVRLAHCGCNNEKADKLPEGVVLTYVSPDTRTRIEKIRDAAIAQFADSEKRARHAAACRLRDKNTRLLRKRGQAISKGHGRRNADTAHRAVSIRLHYALLKALS